MTHDYPYEAWSALDRFASHPGLEEQRKRIIDQTLARIERATMIREMDELLRLRSA